MSKTLSFASKPEKLNDFQIIMALKEETGEGANRYHYLFYNKYKNYIYRVALHRCQIFNEADGYAKEIAQLTFIKAFENLSKFSIPPDIDEKRLNYTIKAWLGKIANNHFNKLYAQYKLEDIDIDALQIGEPSYDMFNELYVNEEEQPSSSMLMLRQAMQQLNEMDRHILVTYAHENCLDGKRHLSDTSIRILCELYKTTPENIRQRKSRAIKKMKSFCLQI
jgi:RNA polymerase sigma factor (sigma-70 family)